MSTVLDRYEGPLLRYAQGILGDIERARDCVQETLLRLWKSEPPGGADGLGEWLFTVCRNCSLDVLRKERRMKSIGENHDAVVSASASPPATAEQGETMTIVAGAVAVLPANQQEVIRLKFQEGFSYKQIAGITGLSISNVGYLIHQAVSALRDEFKSKGLIGRS